MPTRRRGKGYRMSSVLLNVECFVFQTRFKAPESTSVRPKGGPPHPSPLPVSVYWAPSAQGGVTRMAPNSKLHTLRPPVPPRPAPVVPRRALAVAPALTTRRRVRLSFSLSFTCHQAIIGQAKARDLLVNLLFRPPMSDVFPDSGWGGEVVAEEA